MPSTSNAVRYDRALLLEQLGQSKRSRDDLERIYAVNPTFDDVKDRPAGQAELDRATGTGGRQDRALERRRQLDMEGRRAYDQRHLADLRHLHLDWPVRRRPNDIPSRLSDLRNHRDVVIVPWLPPRKGRVARPLKHTRSWCEIT